ncbi:calcium/calmodulin-regulated receptor-like kinase 2 isoform X2 [Hevea brasiliensis]|uniref:calcium/calmodulin-regulated receptor-like kinase 2 isoform X2 n=1 Tax=Hevea brasiliensis TaxID=3981 RepID=UPI0025D7D6B0|nr:calcium/calmodulin-regulated receptor-like kinase 2 isoform X2 [Hevea brasiliensis]
MVRETDLVIIGVSVGLALGVAIASLVFFGIRWYKNRAHLRQCANERSLATLPIRINGLETSNDFSASLTNSTTIHQSEQPPKSSQFFWWNHHSKDQFTSTSGILRYSYKDIQKATQNFTTILGQGSFGPVYKAVMPGGVVAVKVLASNSKQGEKEFQTEVSLLGRLHHRNLVNLLGYCVDKGQHMLIYEFMSNGSLANLLYNEEELVLGWEERLQIALDVSHGIEYLHEGAVPPVIHRDLKSANILLDQSMRAKVADFGLSKEEAYDGRNSGLKAIHPHQNLMEYINLAAMSPDGVDEILDEKLAGECNIEEVRELAAIAHKCLQKSQRKRPSIGEVSQAISKIKQRPLVKEDTMSFASQDFSRVLSRIEDQHVELSKMTSIKESS